MDLMLKLCSDPKVSIVVYINERKERRYKRSGPRNHSAASVNSSGAGDRNESVTPKSNFDVKLPLNLQGASYLPLS